MTKNDFMQMAGHMSLTDEPDMTAGGEMRQSSMSFHVLEMSANPMMQNVILKGGVDVMQQKEKQREVVSDVVAGGQSDGTLVMRKVPW